MWKASVLCVTLVFISVHAEELTDKSTETNKDLNRHSGDITLTSDPASDRPRDPEEQSLLQEFSSLIDYHPNQKRGRNFGFVGSRGRRGETFGDAVFGPEFLVRRPVGSNNSLRKLLGGHHQGMMMKEKRKPHFGFHGSRG